jgi:hypothetical protein
MYSNGHKIYLPYPFKGSQKYNQIGIFGMKIYHPSTLIFPAIKGQPTQNPEGDTIDGRIQF